MSTYDVERSLRQMQEITRRTKELASQAQETEIDVASPDRAVAITVTIQGKVADLKLSERALERYDAESLAKVILDTMRKAQGIADNVGRDMLRRSIPEWEKYQEMLTSARHQGSV
ncbi:MAG: YbaB/EbfC family nucleoid-associated protein [Micromonosporaceae bacterium]